MVIDAGGILMVGLIYSMGVNAVIRACQKLRGLAFAESSEV